MTVAKKKLRKIAFQISQLALLAVLLSATLINVEHRQRCLNVALLEEVRKGNDEQIVKLLHQGAHGNANEDDEVPRPVMRVIADSFRHAFLRNSHTTDKHTGRSALELYLASVPCEQESTMVALVEAGAPADGTDPYLKSIVFMAAMENKNALLRSLLAHGARPYERETNTTQPLIVADAEGTSLLLKAGASVDSVTAEGQTALFTNDGAKAAVLLDAGANIEYRNTKRMTPLIFACANGSDAVALTLMERGADVNARDENGKTPLIYACDKGSVSTVKALLTHGAEINAKDAAGNTPLIAACNTGQDVVALELLSSHADVNAADASGNRSILRAAANCKPDTIRRMIAAGARLLVRDSKGNGPALVAIHNNKDSVFALLVRAGADVTKPNKEGSYPILEAASRCSLEVIELIRKAGGNLQVRDSERNTAVMLAVENNESVLPWVLKSYRGDINAENRRGETALFMATDRKMAELEVGLSGQSNRYSAIIRLLKQRGANSMGSIKRKPGDCGCE